MSPTPKLFDNTPKTVTLKLVDTLPVDVPVYPLTLDQIVGFSQDDLIQCVSDQLYKGHNIQTQTVPITVS